MSTLGNSYDETLGLVTAGTELMPKQAGKVARGLRTIGNNIADTAKQAGELTYTLNGQEKTISLIDKTTGDMKSTFDVMKDIYSNGWKEMSKSEQQALAITLAGKNQFEVFTSVLSNFSNAQSAAVTSTNAFGSASKENERYMESLEARNFGFLS